MDEMETCPICLQEFKCEDICAIDLTEGCCHAACLEGSTVVDLETGEEIYGATIFTFTFEEYMRNV